MWKEAVVASFREGYYYFGICLNGLKKSTIDLRIIDLRADI
jgi:hypothetical protein